MNITKKTQLKNHKFKALRVVKGFAFEDIPQMRANLLSQIEGIPNATMNEDESGFHFSNGQFVLKPIDAIECLSDAKGMACADCKLCSGLAKSRLKSVWINPHGSKKNKAIAEAIA